MYWTLCKLILGLYPPNEGEILLDGQPASIDLWRAWRQHVGVVAQDDRLLSGSIADNIAFFDPELDMLRVQAAATSARVHDDILRMPMQYQSLVGDMGSSLSGGQRQRILLARALYRNPSILILDEGTANLDPQTEDEIAELVSQLSITRIVIAHRPALIERAERVVLVAGGLIEEVGRP
jgi:ATP-binding cassette subfamily B protein RaxB